MHTPSSGGALAFPFIILAEHGVPCLQSQGHHDRIPILSIRIHNLLSIISLLVRIRASLPTRLVLFHLLRKKRVHVSLQRLRDGLQAGEVRGAVGGCGRSGERGERVGEEDGFGG